MAIRRRRATRVFVQYCQNFRGSQKYNMEVEEGSEQLLDVEPH